jgi:hypothetical protein
MSPSIFKIRITRFKGDLPHLWRFSHPFRSILSPRFLRSLGKPRSFPLLSSVNENFRVTELTSPPSDLTKDVGNDVSREPLVRMPPLGGIGPKLTKVSELPRESVGEGSPYPFPKRWIPSLIQPY